MSHFEQQPYNGINLEFESLGRKDDYKPLEDSGELKVGKSLDVDRMEHIVIEELAEKLFIAEENLRKLKEKCGHANQRFEHLLDDEIAFAELEVKTLQERIAEVRPLAKKIKPENLNELINSEASKN